MESLKKISEKMRQTSPVFIVGAPRSGTSILYRVLQRHSTFNPKNMDLTETGIFSYANRSYLFGIEHPRGTRLLEYMLGDLNRYEEFLDSIQVIQRLHKVVNVKAFLEEQIRDIILERHTENANPEIKGKKTVKKPNGKVSFEEIARKIRWLWQRLRLNNPLTRYPLRCFNWVGWHLGLNHYAIRSFFYYAQMARGCDRIIEKTPSNFMHIAEIQWTFPKSKLLYIHRHPVDVFSSYRKRLQFEVEQGKAISGWLDIPPDIFCNKYRIATQYIQKLDDNQDQILLVKYETFTKSPAEEIQRILSFLSESLEENMITEEKKDPSKWPRNPLLFGPIMPHTKDWSDYITSGEAQYIETELKDVMKKLGYKSFTNCW